MSSKEQIYKLRVIRHGIVGALSMALSVALGAIGAHALKSRVSETSLETFQTAVDYHQLHSLSILLFLGLYIGLHSHFPRWPKWAIRFNWCGHILFCGGCYLYVFTQIKTFVHIVPFGGLCFISSWLCLVGYFNKMKASL